MAVSGSFDWLLQRDDIIAAAYKKIGKVARGQSPDSTQVSDAALALNAILKEALIQIKNIPRRIKLVSDTLAASSTTYSITESGALGVTGIYLRDSSGEDFPVETMSRRDYNDIVDKDYVARPQRAFVETAADHTIKLYFDYATDEAYTIKIDVLIELDDMDAAANDSPLPAECNRWLIYQLAADLGDDAGLEDNRLYRLENKARRLFGELKKYFNTKVKDTDNRVEGCY